MKKSFHKCKIFSPKQCKITKFFILVKNNRKASELSKLQKEITYQTILAFLKIKLKIGLSGQKQRHKWTVMNFIDSNAF